MSAIDLSVLPPGRRRFALTWNGGAAALLIVLIFLVIFTFHDYGVTWDEDVHNWYGVFVLDYYLSAFMDSRALHWQDLINYGAAFDMTAALINRISPFGTYETRHLLNGMTGILGLVGVWKAGRFLAGPRAGLFAALLLATIPNYYGQMYNNPKDIPFAVGCIWALYYLCRIVAVLPRPPASLVLKLGIAVGMSLGVRVGGLLLLAYAGLAGTVFCLWRGIETRSVKVALGDGWTGIWRGFLPMLTISYPVMLLFWPWAQQDPIEHPLSALATFSHETFPFKTLFAGQYFPALGISADPYRAGTTRTDHVAGAGGIAGRPAARMASAGRTRSNPIAPDPADGDRDPVSGLLCGGDPGGAVRRHAPFHLRAAADRPGRRAGGRRAVRTATPFPLSADPAGRPRPLRSRPYQHHGAAASRRVCLLQWLHRRC
jgi:hypothetical protein